MNTPDLSPANQTLGATDSMASTGKVLLKRVYAVPEASDGTRVLVDRLWPRGMPKGRAALDLWLKEIAPSPELRRWFSHDLDKWGLFQDKYRLELKANPEPVETLLQLAREGTVTLLFAARDEEHNEAVELRNILQASLSNA